MANGLLAQLVEHIVHIDGVTGSSPVQTTKSALQAQILQGFFFTKAACSHRWRFADGRRLWRVQAVGKRFESSTDHQINPARLALQGFFILFSD